MMLPDKVKAAGDGGNTGISIGGYDAERKPFIYVDFTCGAWGARPWADGLDGNSHMFANMASHSIEVTEAEQPIQLLAYEFVADKAGAGKYRGGVPFRRDYRFLEEEGILQVRSDRRDHRPFGLYGGSPGGPSENYFNPQAENRVLPGKFTMTIKRGDIFRHVLAGAGGWGDPLERDPAAVLKDVRNELLSAGKAMADYGVVGRHRALDDRCGRHGEGARGDPAGARLDRGAQGAMARSADAGSRRGAGRGMSAATYRVGVDIGGTFTDIVLLGADGTIHTKKISSSVDNYAQAIVEGLSELFQRDRPRRRRDRGDPPRHDGGLQRHPRAQGRARRPDHHQGLSRRAGDPHAAHARLYDLAWEKPRASGRALSAPGRRRAGRCARPHRARARRARRRTRRRCAAGREGRGDRRLPAQFLRQSAPRAHDQGDPGAQGARSASRASPSRCCRRSRNTSAPRPPSSTPMSCRSSPATCARCAAASTAPAFRRACC